MDFEREGFYWYRNSDQHRWAVLDVFRDAIGWWCATHRPDQRTWNRVENFPGQWVGPIPEPTEEAK